MSKFDIMETTVAKVQAAYLDGSLTCRELCEQYIARIKAYDHEGPAINSIICVNPRALEEADAFDAYVKEHHKLCGPLHGIPVMLKDNFNTTDMPTTAGSIALEGWVPEKDAFVTKKLREAGALILAKTNLHEFAIWGETISSVMGQSVNPYDPTRTPGGSSGGTGASIACNIGIIGLGTDTINSVRSPSSANSLVGIRPTIGLVSRAGIVPYSLTQDTAALMLLWIVLTALTLALAERWRGGPVWTVLLAALGVAYILFSFRPPCLPPFLEPGDAAAMAPIAW